MSSKTQTLTPEVKWAQRSSATEADKNFIYLTIGAPDVSASSAKIDLQPKKLVFSGYSDTKKANYAVTLEFHAEVDPDKSKIHHSARDIEMKLQKKELNEEFWPRLLNTKDKQHWLKTDFDKWVDEDEQEGVPDDDYMSQFGGGGGMPPMGEDGGFGGLDFSKLGGEGGMPDLSALQNMGLGGAGGPPGGDDSDDDMEEDGDSDMPVLEGEAAGVPAAPKSSGKIEEV